MQIAVVMPTKRHENWRRIIDNLAQFKTVTWMPVMFQDERYAKCSIGYGDCLTPVVIPRPVECLGCGERGESSERFNLEHGAQHVQQLEAWPYLMNAGLDYLSARHFNGWILPLADDDLLPDSYVATVSAAADTDARVIVTSLMRGQHEAGSGYHTSTLPAVPEYMKVCQVNASQALIHWSVFQNHRYPLKPCADGLLIQQLHEEMPQAFRFLPDYAIPFNALEPGRWDEDKLQAALK